MKRMLALFRKVNIAQFLVAFGFVKFLIARVLVQSLFKSFIEGLIPRGLPITLGGLASK